MERENNALRIAVLSGKGGTGKTLVSVNLAAIAGSAVYIDCDVEEPNGYLFFVSDDRHVENVSLKIPFVDAAACTGCRACIDFCRFNALAFIKNKPYVFEEVCHSCGGCSIVCPQKAIAEKDKVIGTVEKSAYRGVTVFGGRLNVGEASGVPIIARLLQEEAEAACGLPVFIDCPPGSSCAVMESIRDADYCILVAEPTLFGAHNLAMVHKLAQLFGKRCGAVLNKCTQAENPSEIYCARHHIPILAKLPFDHALGTLNSNAEIAALKDEKYKVLFGNLLDNVLKEAAYETVADP
jgi:MinD superfamily P-loop ATPase